MANIIITYESDVLFVKNLVFLFVVGKRISVRVNCLEEMKKTEILWRNLVYPTEVRLLLLLIVNSCLWLLK